MKKFSTVTKNIEPNFEKSLEKTLLSYEKN